MGISKSSTFGSITTPSVSAPIQSDLTLKAGNGVGAFTSGEDTIVRMSSGGVPGFPGKFVWQNKDGTQVGEVNNSGALKANSCSIVDTSIPGAQPFVVAANGDITAAGGQFQINKDTGTTSAGMFNGIIRIPAYDSSSAPQDTFFRNDFSGTYRLAYKELPSGTIFRIPFTIDVPILAQANTFTTGLQRINNDTGNNEVLIIKASGGQSADNLQVTNSSNTVLTAIKGNGAFQPVHLANAAAANDTIYFSTDANKLVYKDSGGVVNNLY